MKVRVEKNDLKKINVKLGDIIYSKNLDKFYIICKFNYSFDSFREEEYYIAKGLNGQGGLNGKHRSLEELNKDLNDRLNDRITQNYVVYSSTEYEIELVKKGDN